MTRFTDTAYKTRKEFLTVARSYPELVVLRGVAFDRYGLHSLQSVLDVEAQVYVENRADGWSVLLNRRGRSFAVLG